MAERLQHTLLTILQQHCKLWSPLNSFKDACRSCQSGMWLQQTAALDFPYAVVRLVLGFRSGIMSWLRLLPMLHGPWVPVTHLYLCTYIYTYIFSWAGLQLLIIYVGTYVWCWPCRIGECNTCCDDRVVTVCCLQFLLTASPKNTSLADCRLLGRRARSQQRLPHLGSSTSCLDGSHRMALGARTRLICCFSASSFPQHMLTSGHNY